MLKAGDIVLYDALQLVCQSVDCTFKVYPGPVVMVLPRKLGEQFKESEKEYEIEERMRAMRLSEVAFEPPQTIADALKFFCVASKKYDLPEIPVEKRGFNMILRAGCSKADAPVIPMLRLTDVSFYDALKFVFSSVGYEFEINYEADLDKVIVTIKPCSGSAKCGSSEKRDSIVKYDYVVDTSSAPELDQWMRTKMLPAVREWYPSAPSAQPATTPQWLPAPPADGLRPAGASAGHVLRPGWARGQGPGGLPGPAPRRPPAPAAGGPGLLALPAAAAGARVFLGLPDDDATGIVTMENKQQKADNMWYDLNGRRVNAPMTKGFYVKNGRKMVMK